VCGTWGLLSITKSPDGAQAAVDADVLDFLPELLNSRDAEVSQRTSEILRTLATHGFASGHSHWELDCLRRSENANYTFGL
jgi:hypothetical protein